MLNFILHIHSPVCSAMCRDNRNNIPFPSAHIHNLLPHPDIPKAALDVFTTTPPLPSSPPPDPPKKPQPNLIPSRTIADVFAAVTSGTATYGVVPIENSTNGPVSFTLDLLASGAHADLRVIAETYVPVHHCLLGWPNPTSAPAGTADANPPDLTHITHLHSHPMAWGQCTRFLSQHLFHAQRHDASSTSAAAALVAASPRPRDPTAPDAGGCAAAISSPMAAAAHGVPVLARNIEDRADNVTRFVVLCRRDASGSFPAAGAGVGEAAWKSMLLLRVEHAHAGALSAALGALARRGVNVVSINARPSGLAAWQYRFVLEVEGRGGEGSGVEGALEEWRGAEGVREVGWLGQWRAGRRE